MAKKGWLWIPLMWGAYGIALGAVVVKDYPAVVAGWLIGTLAAVRT